MDQRNESQTCLPWKLGEQAIGAGLCKVFIRETWRLSGKTRVVEWRGSGGASLRQEHAMLPRRTVLADGR